MTAIANLPDFRPSLLLDFANSGRVDPRIQCTRASTATCFGPDGKLRTVAANIPRIDYDPATGKRLGLLVEEARTNLWLNSAAASSAQSVSVTAQSYTLSFEGTGSIALAGAATGDTSSGMVLGGRRVMTFTATAGTLTCTPSGDVRNVQLEAGPFHTSYIPTGATAVTRAADSIQVDLSGLLPNSGFSYVSEQSVDWGGGEYPIIFSDSKSSLGAYIGIRNSPGGMYINSTEGGRTTSIPSRPSNGTFFKMGASFSPTAASIAARDGVSIAGGAPSSVVDISKRTNLKLATTSAPATLCMRLRNLRIYSAQLSESQLQRLTA